MFIVKAAFENIKQSMNKYILFGILLLLVTAACVISFFEYDLSYNILEDIKNEFGSILVINYKIPKDQIDEISKSVYIKEIRYTKYIYKIDKGHIDINDENFLTLSENDNRFNHLFLAGYNMEYGNILNNPDTAFLLDGRMFENDDECIITDKFIEKYNLKGTGIKIGDNLKITNETVSKTYIVAGIIDSGKLFGRKKTNYAFIYTTMNSASAFENDEVMTYLDSYTNTKYSLGYNVLYYLKSYNDYKSFGKETFNKYNLLPQYAKEGFEVLITPLENTQEVSLIFIVVVLFIGALITIIITFLNLNERKYEIGVLRSIGMSKPMIMMLFIIEIFIFITVVIIIGIITGYALAGFFTENITTDDITLNNAAITMKVFLKIIFAGFGLTLISSLMFIIYIIKYQPMEILRNRN